MRLWNSLGNRLETFEPLVPGEVRMYNCGPTVYSRPHIGNYRAYVSADLLRRAFEHHGYRVTQVVNITDVGHLTEDDVADAAGEDKLQAAAERLRVDPWRIAREVEAQFHEDLSVLRCLPAHHYPRATEHIPEMIAIIERLLAKGHAYVADGNVYFSVGSFPGYGKLSGNTVDRLEAGAGGRVGAREEKRSPHDFALWKRDPKHLMQWDSPWGRGFPGWHIECSAMSMKYLGASFDVHTGGPDNKFPHHECEIAQSECANGVPFVRYWLHPGWLEISGEKMSKSKGELFTIPELLAMGFSGADIRFLLVRQHYRAPLPFTLDLLKEARSTRARFDNFLHHELAGRPTGGGVREELEEGLRRARAEFRAAIGEDLNTAAALAAVHEMMRLVNRLQPSREEAQAAADAMREFDRVLAILGPAPAEGDAEIDRLIAERIAARKSRDFRRADAIRDELAARGIELLDTAQGTRWRRRPPE